MDNDNNNNGGGGGGEGHPFADNLVVLLIAMGSAAFVVSIYHLLAICLCNHHFSPHQNQNQNQEQPRRVASSEHNQDHNSSSSLAHLIPTHKYHKKQRIIDGDDDDEEGCGGSTCAVCLGDFEEGDELRSLPECMHSFHMQCIDMWLHSHTSCPICRASATPSPLMLQVGSGSGDQQYLNNNNNHNPNHTINIMQISLVQPIV